MNEFSARKLGEVLAFCNAGVEIFEKGQEPLKGLLNEEYQQTIDTLKEQALKIESIAKDAKVWEVTSKKAEGTKSKLLSMSELYIGDQWDNPAELMEWFGFFEGAAIMHWELVEGSGQGLRDESLETLASRNIELHTNLLNKFGDLIKEYAINKVA